MRRITQLVAIRAAVLVGGCASSDHQSKKEPAAGVVKPVDYCVEKNEIDLSLNSLSKARAEIKEKFNIMLNCKLGPTLAGNKPVSREIQLLRGHMAVVGLATYGRFNVTGEVAGGARQVDIDLGDGQRKALAGDIIMSIHSAERHLRGATDLFTDTTFPRPYKVGSHRPAYQGGLDFEYRIELLSQVFDVLRNSAAPTKTQARRLGSKLISAFSGANPKNILTAAKGFKTAVEKLGTIKKFTKLYLEDSKDYLNCVYMAENAKPPLTQKGSCEKTGNFKDRWKLWDAELKRECEILTKNSGASSTVSALCTPGSYQ